MVGVRKKLGKKRSHQLTAGKGASKKTKKPSTGIDFSINDASDDDSDDGRRGHRRRRKNDFDEDLESDEESFTGADSARSDDEEEESDDEKETVDAKRVRLAREYLRRVEGRADDDDATTSSSDAERSDDEYNHDGGSARPAPTLHDKVGQKLARERLKREGMLERRLASAVADGVASLRSSVPSSASQSNDVEAQARSWIEAQHVRYVRGHDLPPTCVALHSSGERAFSGSKDNSVIMYDVERSCRLVNVLPQWKQTSMEHSRGIGEVLALACSDDGRYLGVGGRDATVRIFDVRIAGKGGSSGDGLITTFTGHKGPVTSLAFRSQALQLFSGSEDRCLRHYNLDEMAYVETLYGHQAGVTGVDCHRRERLVSTGRDRTARAWKLAEDTHLIFRGGSRVSAADCVSVVKDDWFVTGHDDGKLSLWLTDKKKALATVQNAHGCAVGAGGLGLGIVSINALKGSDLAATGSNDGFLRLWKVMTGQSVDERGIAPVEQVPLHGFVNGVAIGPKARFCVAAVGQEPRLGRWSRVPRAKNRFAIIKLRHGAADDEDGHADEVMPSSETMSKGKGEELEQNSARSSDGTAEEPGGGNDSTPVHSSEESSDED